MASTERLTIPSPGNVQLEGLLHLPQQTGAFAAMVVCHPHPLYGGDMHNPVVQALCRAGLRAGFAVLRFNFRGTGGSTGVHEGGKVEADDVRAAAAFLAEREEVSSVDVLAGYSFGAMMAVAAADVARALLLVSPPLGMAASDRLPEVPLLALTGDMDDYVDVAALRAALSSPESDLVVAEGADHFWWGREAFLVEQAEGFLKARATLGA